MPPPLCSRGVVGRFGRDVARAGTKGTADTLRDLKALLVAYARQETLDPLRSLGRSLGWGLRGALLIGSSVLFGALAILRLLQSETDAFDSTWSWVPYLIVALLMAAVVGAALYGIGRTTRRPDPARRHPQGDPRVTRTDDERTTGD